MSDFKSKVRPQHAVVDYQQVENLITVGSLQPMTKLEEYNWCTHENLAAVERAFLDYANLALIARFGGDAVQINPTPLERLTQHVRGILKVDAANHQLEASVQAITATIDRGLTKLGVPAMPQKGFAA